MKTHQKHLSTLFAIAALLGGTSQGFAATIAPSLGTASNFVVLGGAGVTCTASAVSGDVGSLVTVTGFPTPAPGTLTLDAGGDANAVWVIQVGTAITTGSASVAMINGGQQQNVFWQLGTAATIGTDTAFTGNILAGSAITFTGANATLVGRALAKTAVTMTGATLSQGSSVVVVPSPVCK